jgi:hypothetical protein
MVPALRPGSPEFLLDAAPAWGILPTEGEPMKTMKKHKQASQMLMEALVDRVGAAKAQRLVQQARIDLDKEIEQYAKKQAKKQRKGHG